MNIWRGQYRLLAGTVLTVAVLTWVMYWPETFDVAVVRGVFGLGCALLLCVMFVSSRMALKQKIVWLRSIIVALLWVAVLMGYGQWRMQSRALQVVPMAWLYQTFLLDVEIVDLPVRTPFGVRFTVQSLGEQSDAVLRAASDAGALPQRVSIFWNEDDLPNEPLQIGQVWRLPVSFKPPHASYNPGGFDQEKNWWMQGVRALATVRLKDERSAVLLAQNDGVWLRLQRWRAATLAQIDVALAGDDSGSAAVFKALALGDQSDVSTRQWQLFQQTGVTHLVSISGVHITMLAALMMWCVRRLWRRSVRLCEWMPSLHAAQWAGLMAALLYAVVAGWALPAQRTVLMLALWLLFSRVGVAQSAVRVLCFALLAVVLWDPFSVLSLSFWLSFGAVAWLVLAFSHLAEMDADAPVSKTRWRQKISVAVGTQLATGTSLLPISVYFFRQASLSGVLINLLAIPLVSGLVTPLLLLATLCMTVLGWDFALRWANKLLALCLRGLSWVNETLPSMMWQLRLVWWQVLLVAILSVALVLMWRRRSLWLSAALTLCLVGVLSLPVMPGDAIDDGEVRVDVLDVGQGSAVLLRTRTQVWLYDAGPRYGHDSDAGLRVVLPFLREHGIRAIDVMVLSHNDIDHTGGAATISQAIPVRQIISSIEPARLSEMAVRTTEQSFCATGQSWQIDGVAFSMLSPTAEIRGASDTTDNQKSCVLRIDAQSGQLQSMILAGDVDTLQEARLVVSPAGGVRDWHTDVLMMSHHGSSHGSSAPWLEATTPKLAIAQAGFMNHFQHPHPLVVSRYRTIGTDMLNTADNGAIALCLGCERSGMTRWREQRRYIWLDSSNAQAALIKNN